MTVHRKLPARELMRWALLREAERLDIELTVGQAVALADAVLRAVSASARTRCAAPDTSAVLTPKPGATQDGARAIARRLEESARGGWPAAPGDPNPGDGP